MSKAIRLDKLLANLGYGSRRDVATAVRVGRVALDGVALARTDERIAMVDAARLTIAGQPIDPLPGLVLMVHKPVGMTCSQREAGPLVYDLLPERWRRRDPPLSSVGRLDKDTSGLLLVTDDGALLHKIIAPKSHVPKRYRAALARPLADDTKTLFASGTLMLEGETVPLLPAGLEVLSRTDVRITITEGRYHQVRRMFAAAGNHVESLHREAVGGWMLPDTIEAGAYRVLAAEEVAAVFAVQADEPASALSLSAVSRK